MNITHHKNGIITTLMDDKMNAYDMANEIEDSYCEGEKLTNVSNMLRQQADRIAELEKQLNLHKNAHHKCVEILQEKQSESNCYGDGNVYRGVRCKDSEIQTIPFTPWSKEQDLVDSWKHLDTTPQTKDKE